MNSDGTTLLTGFPQSLVARQLLGRLASAKATGRISCLVAEGSLDRARALVDGLPEPMRAKVKLLKAELAAMDFGLSGKAYLQLAEETRQIHHCDAITHPGVHRQVAERVHVDGTAEVLELAETSTKLERMVLWSSALISGRRGGLIPETELEPPPSFRNVIEETRFVAEGMVRERMDRIPTTILRPSILVGDSRTGEIDRFEGPYLVVLLMLSAPMDLRLPLPARGQNALPLVPIDYVVEAGYRIASDPRSVGHTYHLVDPQPRSAKRVFDIIAEITEHENPVTNLPAGIATRFLRTPGLNRVSKVPQAFVAQLATNASYDSRNTQELLGDTDLRCPRVEDYANVLVEYVRARQKAARDDRPQPVRPVQGTIPAESSTQWDASERDRSTTPSSSSDE